MSKKKTEQFIITFVIKAEITSNNVYKGNLAANMYSILANIANCCWIKRAHDKNILDIGTE